MDPKSYEALIDKLESDELEGDCNLELYVQLFALYLYKEDLVSAKFLWKRMPQNIKSDKEIERLKVLMIAAKHNNNAAYIRNFNYPWSENIKSVMNQLLEKIRENLFILIGSAYCSIYEEQLMEMSLLTREQLRDIYKELQWTYEKEGEKIIVFPKPKKIEQEKESTSEEQLQKLTNFITFLEN